MFTLDGMTFDDELTGLAEHERDEAHECGEYAAMRAEAEAFHASETAMAEAEAAEDEAEDARRYPGGRCALDDPKRYWNPRMCETRDDEICF